MRHGTPDRVPVMCQLALGHYFLRSGGDAVDIWHDGEAFASALVTLQRRYGFDGILVNLPGRDPEWRQKVDRVEAVGRDRHVVWRDGRVTSARPTTTPTSSCRTAGRARFPGSRTSNPTGSSTSSPTASSASRGRARASRPGRETRSAACASGPRT